jgi:hypothetical protein
LRRGYQSSRNHWEVNKDLIGCLANICMLSASENKRISDKPPSKYIDECRSELGDRFDDVMSSNLVPPEAVECMLTDDFAGFLEVRSAYLSEVVQGLV